METKIRRSTKKSRTLSTMVCVSDISTDRDKAPIIPELYNKSDILCKLQEEFELIHSQLNLVS